MKASRPKKDESGVDGTWEGHLTRLRYIKKSSIHTERGVLVMHTCAGDCEFSAFVMSSGSRFIAGEALRGTVDGQRGIYRRTLEYC